MSTVTMTRKWGAMRRLAAVFLSGALLVTAACGGGDKKNDSASDGPSRPLFQPAGVIGPDSFSPSFAAATYQATAARQSTDPSVTGLADDLAAELPPTIQPGSIVDGSTPGIYAGRTYGGSGANICDVEKMITFLTAYEDRGRAWAATQGIAFEDLGTYLRSLTPVFALYNLNVTMFGFKNGKSYSYAAVLEAGTAILIDEYGMPRARCACGNPLLSPTEDVLEGTDSPTPDEGNPQTQDSVPADDAGDEPGDEPGELPVPEREPACPEWNSPVVRYVDTNGMLWQLNPFTGKWISLDDPALVNIDAADLPGFLERCADPEPLFAPECPTWNQVRNAWNEPAEFVDSSGNLWEPLPGISDWGRTGSEERRALDQIPGYAETCLDPLDSRPTCPTPTSEGYTPYQNAFGETFEYALGAGWYSTVTEQRYGDPENIPGYVEDCGAPGQSSPCPPLRPTLGEIWVGPDGSVWTAESIDVDVAPGVDVDPWSAIGWRNSESGAVIAVNVLHIELCGDLRLAEPREPLCPPRTPAVDEMWVDTAGSVWVYGAGKGGTYGWDNQSTTEVEVFRTSELPNVPDGCDPVDPPRHWACPPILNITEGDTYLGSNGSLYSWIPASGGWVGTSGDVIVYTVLLPGFRQRCLPPCPPADAHKTPAPGIWVDPSTGDIWVKIPARQAWFNFSTAEVRNGNAVVDSVDDTASLPFWKEECQPPCAPGTDGEPTFARDDDGRPVGIDDDVTTQNIATAVTIQRSGRSAQLAPVIFEHRRAVMAVGDDCNPTGCVDLTRVPALGHYFVDSYGVVWRYTSNDTWQSENGDSVYTIFDVPGYGEACLPDNTVPQRDCPAELEGNRYTDWRNITWIWVGGNSSEPGDGTEKLWFARHDDGSVEYRYTFQLDPFLAGCPRPDDVDEPLDMVLRLDPPRNPCAGEATRVVLSVVELVPGARVQYELSIDGRLLGSGSLGEGVYVLPWTPPAPGDYVLVGFASTSGGHSSELAVPFTARDCDEPRDPASGNSAPIVELGFRPTCVEVASSGSARVDVILVIADADEDSVTVRVSGDSPGGPVGETSGTVNGSGELILTFDVPADRAGQTITFDVLADDGVAQTSARGTVRVESAGGCSPTTTVTPATTPTTTSTLPPTTSTLPPTTSTLPPTTTTRPPTTTSTLPPTTTVANRLPDVGYDLDSSQASVGQCIVRVSAVDPDAGQTLYIGSTVSEATNAQASSTFGEVIRTYTVSVQPFSDPNARGSLPSGHAAFDSAGGRVSLSYTVRIVFNNGNYTCQRV